MSIKTHRTKGENALFVQVAPVTYTFPSTALQNVFSFSPKGLSLEPGKSIHLFMQFGWSANATANTLEITSNLIGSPLFSTTFTGTPDTGISLDYRAYSQKGRFLIPTTTNPEGVGDGIEMVSFPLLAAKDVTFTISASANSINDVFTIDHMYLSEV